MPAGSAPPPPWRLDEDFDVEPSSEAVGRGLVLAVDGSPLLISPSSLASLVQMSLPLQTNQILQDGLAMSLTAAAFLDLGARIFLE